MKTSIAVAVAGCCVLGGVWAMAGEKAEEDPSSEVDMLKRRIALIEQQLEVLKVRVNTLEEGQRVIPRVVPAPQMPWQSPGQAAPEGWVPREFNGRTYYAIPIGDDPNGAPSQR